jgi:hypothetical protein
MSRVRSKAPARTEPSLMNPHLPIDPTDVFALVLMALYTMRRFDLRATDPRAFPGVPRAEFDAWKSAALRARSFSINACFLKFAANNLWFYGFRRIVPPRVLGVGGALVFAGWIFALVFAAWRSRSAHLWANRLGIVVGRRVTEERRGPPESPAPPGAGASESEASSH